MQGFLVNEIVITLIKGRADMTSFSKYTTYFVSTKGKCKVKSCMES